MIDNLHYIVRIWYIIASFVTRMVDHLVRIFSITASSFVTNEIDNLVICSVCGR